MDYAGEEAIIGRLGRSQHGAMSLAQLTEAGVSRRAVERRLRRGQLVRLGSGLYVVNGTPTSIRRDMHVALLATNRLAALSHESAGELHHFSYMPRGRVVVTVSRSAQYRIPADRVHRKADLRPEHIVVVDGLRSTSRARTMVDVAAALGRRRLERVLDDQLASGDLTYDAIVVMFNSLARRGRDGIGLLRPLLEVRGDGYVAPSSLLEARFLELVRDHCLPEPSRQHLPPWAVVDGIGRVDFAYPQRRLLVEVDGRRWHSRDQANEEDRFRDQQAVATGWRVLRYTWAQVTRQASYVADNLRATLSQQAA